jgi:hypothetical protein
MDAATRERVSARWAEYGLSDLAKRGVADEWSGQGPARLARLLASASASPDDAAPRSERVKEISSESP